MHPVVVVPPSSAPGSIRSVRVVLAHSTTLLE